MTLRPFQVESFPNLRYVNAPGSGLTLQRVVNNHLLIHLGLARCRLTHLHQVYLPNLHSLDVSDNLLHHLSLANLTKLRQLKLLVAAGNPLSFSARASRIANASNPILEQLHTLDLSRVSLPRLDLNIFRHFPELRVLNLSGCNVDTIVSDGTQLPFSIHTMDLQECPLSVFPRHMLIGLAELRRVYSDNYKLCCKQVLHSSFNMKNCVAPEDDISSCNSLLRSAFLRVSVAVMASLGLCTNLAALTMQVSGWRSLKATYGVFFCNMCVSGLTAGSYHAVLGIAGWLYEGSYLWRDTWWTHSTVCQLTAFLWMLSLQTSLLVLALVTLHSFLLLRFPAGNIQFSLLSARLICVCAWLCSSILAAAPWMAAKNRILPTSVAICVPLSFTLNDINYLSTVVTLYTFLLLTVLVMQTSISSYVQSKSLSFISRAACSCQTRTRETVALRGRCTCESRMDFARRFSGMVSAKCLCWLPVPVVAILVHSGHHVPAQLSVIILLLLLPLSPAVSPILYSVDLTKERRRHLMQDRLMKRVGGKA